MAIDYDEDFTKVMTELKTNFGWSNIEVLPDSYRDLLNDTIKAVKNSSKHDSNVQSDSLSVLIERGQCKNCKHWNKYSDGSMKCAFYRSMPKTSDGDKWCDIDNINTFGFESKVGA